MPDFRVKYVGDLGNLAQFDAAVRNSTTQNVKAIEQANKNIASRIAPISTELFNPNTSGAGLYANRVKATIDGVNKTFIQSGDVIRRTISDYEREFDSLGNFKGIKSIFSDQYEGSYKQNIGDLEKYKTALLGIAPTEQKILADREATLNRTIPLEAKLTDLKTRQQNLARALRTQGQNVDFTQSQLNNAIIGRDVTSAFVNQGALPQSALTKADREVKQLRADLVSAKAELNALLTPLDTQINSTQAKINKILASQQGRAAGLRSLNPAYGDLEAAANATPPINANLATILAQSKQVRKGLLTAGLGAGGGEYSPDSEAFKKVLADQEAQVSRYTENLRTNVKTVQGSFKDLSTGIVKEFSVDLDKNGKVIGRWGGQLSGAGAIVRQTVRDFQKVVEWTAATTLVFGSLAAIVGQLKSINELNTSLARLSVTAQTSSEETNKLFTALGQVAIDTATPLKEIVSAADDIALATRNASGSTEEWHKNIIELTKAVGIYTNLAGVDTVQATDQLNAAFKQLGIAPNELINVLNKVTAVAGGQSGAIKDIISGISGLAEAAQAAGLSLDQQIASIQVLSQVTNKTSAEVTTSFKNLFGSVSSVGSEKVLKKFGIQIRDSSGGLKGFLEIYKEIKSAIDTGVIPQNRLPDVLRGISGGPRRAPDAAALLSNLGRIDEVVAKSQNATNEALIANAKILDTNAAKITQFQNAISITVFEKFGKVVSDLVGVLAGFGTVLATALNSLDANVIKVVIELGAFALAAKTIGGLVRLLDFSSWTKGLQGIVTGFKAATLETTAFATAAIRAKAASIGPAPTGPGTVIPLGPGGAGTGGILNTLKNNKGRLAALGLAGAAGVGVAVAGGLNTNSIGSALQLGGTLVALIPGLQAVGIAAALLGTGLQIVQGDAEKVKQSAHDLSIETETLVENLKAAQENAKGFADAQADAEKSIEKISSKTVKTADDLATLKTAQDAYAEATLGLVSANQEAAKSFDLVLESLKKLTSVDPEKYKAFLSASGGLSSESLKALQIQLTQDLLKASQRQVYATTNPATVTQQYYRNPFSGGDTTTLSGNKEKFNFQDLTSDPTQIKKLFDFQTNGSTQFRASINTLSQNNIALIQGAINQLPNLIAQNKGGGITEDQVQKMVDALNSLIAGLDTYNSNLAAVAQLQTGTQAKLAFGQFTPQEGQNANQATGLIQALTEAQNTYIKNQPLPPGSPDITDRRAGLAGANTNITDAQKQIFEFTKKANEGLGLTNQEIIKAARSILTMNGTIDLLGKAGDEAINHGLYTYLKDAGLSADQLDQISKLLGQDLQRVADIAEEVAAAFDDARKSAASTYAQQILQIETAQNSGQYKNNQGQYQKDLDNAKAQLDANNALIDSTSKLSEVQDTELVNSLSNVIGLQGDYLSQTDIANLKTGDAAKFAAALTQKLLSNAAAAGVNAEGMKLIEIEVAKLIGIIVAIPTYKQVIIDVTTLYSEGGRTGNGSKDVLSQKRLVDAIKARDAAKAAGTDPEAEAKKIADIISKTIRDAVIPATGGAAKGLNVSTLDIPAELKKLNESGLLSNSELMADIQKAYKTAAALQHKIPGYDKQASNDIVDILEGTKKLTEFKGVKEDLLRKALEELAAIEKARLEFETKADTIRRIRVQSGDFAAIANVPFNAKSGISVGGPQGPITVNLNVNGQILTKAQMDQIINQMSAAIKNSLASGAG